MPLLTDTDSIGHILLVYSVVIAVGMALGRIKVFGISLGVTFVLFVALAVSYAGITVNGTVLNFLRDFGLILFVFFIGPNRKQRNLIGEVLTAHIRKVRVRAGDTYR